MILLLWSQLIGGGDLVQIRSVVLSLKFGIGSRGLLSVCGCLDLLVPDTPTSRKGCSKEQLTGE
jgi:hypothetical protein